MAAVRPNKALDVARLGAEEIDERVTFVAFIFGRGGALLLCVGDERSCFLVCPIMRQWLGWFLREMGWF